MNNIISICLLFSFAATASAVVVRPDSTEDGLRLRDQLTNSNVPVQVIQLPSKIVKVNVPGKTETKYVTLPTKKAIVPAAEFAGMKKEWDDELEAAQCEIALKYAYRLDVAPVDGDTMGNAKKDDVDKAAKACAAAPSAITRKALVGAVERMIAR
jgi:hypothetical protein